MGSSKWLDMTYRVQPDRRTYLVDRMLIQTECIANVPNKSSQRSHDEYNMKMEQMDWLPVPSLVLITIASL